MNVDEARIEQYFLARSSAIDITAGDPATIAARASTRRKRRRSAGTGLLALALVAGAVTVQQRGEGGSKVTADATATGVADPLEWTTVVPRAGLAWSNAPVVGASGTMFGLSTAPGRHDPDDPAASRTTLYRSSDGVEWSTVALPDDLYPNHLAMNGDRLYAVGTAPAGGGGRRLVLADGGADGSQWSRVDLPLDLAALDERYGDAVSVSGLSVAAGPDGVVASVNVNVWADAAQFVPPGTDVSGGWQWTAEGLVIHEPLEGCEVTDEAGRREACAKPMPAVQAPVAATFTWAQLGISDELRSLIQGELHVFASADGTSFGEVALPEAATGASTLVATDDGFVLFAQTWSSDRSAGEVTALLSPDGRSWTADPSARFAGYLEAAGRVDGRGAVAVATYGDAFTGFAHVQQPDGSWSTLDLTGSVAVEPGERVVGSMSAIGPMGIATAVYVDDANDSDGAVPQQYIVYSPDGLDVTALDVSEYLAGGYLSTLRVSADAVFAGLSTARTDPNADPSMRLLVGTPAGDR